MLSQRLFLNFSELQVRVDGVGAMPHRLDAVDVASREPTRRVSERRQSRETVSINTGPLRAAGLPIHGNRLRPDGRVPALPPLSCGLRRDWSVFTRECRGQSRRESQEERLEGRF